MTRLPRQNKVIIILGPTCVGKTGLSILLAKHLKTEIISADSMLVYRHMDIGTAKPSDEELRAVPHHLINILEPSESFSAGLFREQAAGIIDTLHDRNKIPVIAGGTGLYIRTLTKGLFEGPSADQIFRKKLREEESRKGKGYLYDHLAKADPEAASKIEPNDTRRVVRALEILSKDKRQLSVIQGLSTRPSGYDFTKIGLSRDRQELYQMIEKRVDRMMEDGLLSETKEFLKRKPARTALQALGYKELGLYLKGEVEMDEAVRLIKKRTKLYAKRQFTWFRKEPDIHWVDITGIMKAEDIAAQVLNDVAILQDLIYS
ncbi:MAG: tRNA (adenosine(37)-N6)-dimethylallyltransferase MiaA [Nitrospiraceae bacterium]|nr:MAG: tRNA (adenosine(37)-N6)-dimethylallyltransferase MiaA [Nitrospiraceae bacterium]